jgi:hypothetical protein
VAGSSLPAPKQSTISDIETVQPLFQVLFFSREQRERVYREI